MNALVGAVPAAAFDGILDAVERPGFRALLIVLAVMAVARVFELFVAARLTRRAAVRGEAPAREPIFAVMVALHVLPFVLTPLEVLGLERRFSLPLFAVTTTALAILLGLRVWTLSTLGARWNVRIVRPDVVVTSGPYRFVRHPNYAIVIAELFALPLVHGAWLTCLVLTLLNAAVLAVRIPAEERMLSTLPGYIAAMGRKPRFLPLRLTSSDPTGAPPA